MHYLAKTTTSVDCHLHQCKQTLTLRSEPHMRECVAQNDHFEHFRCIFKALNLYGMRLDYVLTMLIHKYIWYLMYESEIRT